MNIGVTGYKGFVGSELVRRGCIPLECDITKTEEIKDAVAKVKPDIIIHCAALTDVEYVEEHFKEGFLVNVRGTANIADAVSEDTFIIYLSSDHVFPGTQFWVHGYNERAVPKPTNRYGFLKWGGELALLGNKNKLIVRSSKMYNLEWLMPTITRLQNNETIEFTDVIKRSFMYLPYFVGALLWLAENRNKLVVDTLHVSGESVFSYYLFWSIIQKHLELPGILVPRKYELENVCPRPIRAGLDTRLAKSLGVPMGSLLSALNDIKEKLCG